MYTDFYERISRPWRQLADGPRLLTTMDSSLRIAVAAGYVVLLAALAFQGDVARLVRAIAVPALTFFAASAIRSSLNAERPYEANPLHPLIQKDTQGKSMPSRHMASATIIAYALWWAAGIPWGIIGLVVCAAIGYVRVVGGVHFPRDIVAAFALSSVCAIVGFVLIP